MSQPPEELTCAVLPEDTAASPPCFGTGPVSRAAELWTNDARLSGHVEQVAAGESLMVLGVPRSGRTSWLTCLAERLRTGHPDVRVAGMDARDLTLSNEAKVSAYLADALLRHPVDPPETLDALVARVKADGDAPVALLIDNYEALGHVRTRDHGGPDRMLTALGALATARSGPRVGLVLAGTSDPQTFEFWTGSSAFKYMPRPTYLRPLDREATGRAWHHVEEHLGAGRLTATEAFELTGGWPALLKQLAAALSAGDGRELGDALIELDRFFQLQWERLFDVQRRALVLAAQGRTPSSAEAARAGVDYLRTAGLLDGDGPRGTRWHRFLERQAIQQEELLVPLADTDLAAADARRHARVKRWVDGEVWLVNQLPQMVDHSFAHARRVDINAMMLLSARDRARRRTTAPQLYEVLSGAAWLHDIGHSGGYLDPEIVTDFRHVRKFHGYFSQQIITNRPNLFPPAWDAYSNEEAIGAAAALLSAFHQRHTVLSDERYWEEGFAPSAGRVCQPAVECSSCAAATTHYGTSLVSRIRQEDLGGYFGERDLLELAALLRVADAMDIGAHRVSGRFALGQRSAESFWYSKAAGDLHAALRTVADWSALAGEKELSSRLQRLLPDVERSMRSGGHRSCQTVAEALAADLGDIAVDEPFRKTILDRALAAVDDFRDFVSFLAAQEDYRRLHDAFARSFAYDRGNGSFDVVLAVHPGALPETARDHYAEAAQYVWSEYLGVEPIMESAGLRLNAVRGERHQLEPVTRAAARQALNRR